MRRTKTPALKVDASRARVRLGWAPRLRLADALRMDRRLVPPALPRAPPALVLTDQQIARYKALAPDSS